MYAHNTLNRPTRIVEIFYLYRIIRNSGFYDRRLIGIQFSEQDCIDIACGLGLNDDEYQIDCIGKGV